ncbi:WXG100 family type VII secretion target [Streptomyces millisiae]|uniref:WXG100 family type VII secretion target n=1 Tax=Streptomyces millisiae TaxID=3075542 RepID=A0ABU2LTV9_9ACTN|nr:WXG100 family type VII secretion target [Streptomyces sp. DSM 44918]MDT0321040.1 WXG100 family type VII secretion target [Streptomyces sp. DSM 44918]
MSDPNLRVTGSTISELTRDMDDVTRELQGIRSRVSGANAQAQANWSGETARAHAQGAEELDAVLGRLTRSLGNLRDLVQMSADGFTAEEQEQAAQVRAATTLNDRIAGR